MKCVILAGGLGTRISEESHLRPKPMIEIGGRPIVWHIMKLYACHGVNEFIICLGYKGYIIKEYFANYALHMSDVTFDNAENRMEVHQRTAEPWRVTLVDTGDDTQTGGRLRRVQRFIGEETFCFTYGDGLSDVRIDKLVDFHCRHNKLATVTAVQPPGRYGTLTFNSSGQVHRFEEKPAGDGAWINGGFFVLEPGALDYVDGDNTSWEGTSLQRLTIDSQLSAFPHHGFWHAMDTLRDRNLLETLWSRGDAPWKVWQ